MSGGGRIVRAHALTLCAALAAGCMSQSRVADVTIRNAGTDLPAPRAIADTEGELATLGPLTRIHALGPGGRTDWYEAGDLWVQKDLAKVIQQIAAGGADAFYRGEIGRASCRERVSDTV